MFKYEREDDGSVKRVDAFADVDAEALAILQSQMLNYRARSTQILASEASSTNTLARVYATGGAAKNQTICNVMSEALDCPVSKPVVWDAKAGKWKDADWNACSVGVAYKARWGYERQLAAAKGDDKRTAITFDDFIAECHGRDRAKLDPSTLKEPGAPDEKGETNVALPGEGAQAYADAVGWWKELEDRALSEEKK